MKNKAVFVTLIAAVALLCPMSFGLSFELKPEAAQDPNLGTSNSNPAQIEVLQKQTQDLERRRQLFVQKKADITAEQDMVNQKFNGKDPELAAKEAKDRVDQLGKEVTQVKSEYILLEKKRGALIKELEERGWMQRQWDRISANWTGVNESEKRRNQINELRGQMAEVESQHKAKGGQLNQAENDLRETQTHLSALQKVLNEIGRVESSISRLDQQQSQSQGKLDELHEQRQHGELEKISRDQTAKKLDELKKIIFAKLKAGQPVTSDQLVEATLRTHLLNNLTPSLNSVEQRLNVLSSGTQRQGVVDFKMAYEQLLADQYHRGQALIYNRDHTMVQSALFDNRAQCYSGTLLFLLLSEMRTNRFQNLVVILTSGHILPGFVATEKAGKILYGIETTASGRGLVKYGKTDQIGGQIRVFDAREFLIFELFKNEIQNLDDVFKQMTASVLRLGFKAKNLLAFQASSAHLSSKALGSTPFAFGQIQIPLGDLKRTEMDKYEDSQFNVLPKKRSRGADGIVFKMQKDQIVPCEEFVPDFSSWNGPPICSDLSTGKEIYYSDYLSRAPNRFRIRLFGEPKEGLLVSPMEIQTTCTGDLKQSQDLVVISTERNVIRYKFQSVGVTSAEIVFTWPTEVPLLNVLAIPMRSMQFTPNKPLICEVTRLEQNNQKQTHYQLNCTGSYELGPSFRVVQDFWCQ